MRIEQTSLSGVLKITPKKWEDSRGCFAEIFRADMLRDHGFESAAAFCQDNYSFSAARHTLRGLHFQHAPMAQDKLVRCSRGAVLDIAVDIRPDSPHFGRYVSEVLTADNMVQLLVPKGFAHGFLTLEEACEVHYKVTNYYSAEHDAGIAWDDPDIAIDWQGLGGLQETPTLSDKDSQQPLLADVTTTIMG